MTPGEHIQRETDYQFGCHEQRQANRRFAEPNPEVTLAPLERRAPMSLAEFMEAEDERERACHAIERNLDRNGIPEPQPTRYQWPTT